MSHYFQPSAPTEVQAAAVDDWVEMLLPFSQQAIEHGCRSYLRDQPRRRPSPGDVRARASAFGEAPQGEGDRAKLTPDERALLDEKVLPTARKWLRMPGLADQGRRTLSYWGESHD